MIAFGIYLLKASVCLAIFYGMYLLLFRGLTFFRFNRLYLLTGLAGSFIIPVLKLSLWTNSYPASTSPMLLETFGESFDLHAIENTTNAIQSTDYGFIIMLVYFAGLGFMLCRILYFLMRIIKIQKHSTIVVHEGLKIIKTKESHPFSFFNLVFVPDYKIHPFILEHERAHIRQLHWIDLLLAEGAKSLLWFNPMIYRYKRSIQLQHEYLADHFTIVTGAHPEQYLHCILNQLKAENTFEFTSPFYSTSIKQRIDMITKNKTSVRSSLRYLVLIPMVSLLLFGFSNRTNPLVTVIESEIEPTDENIPSVAPVEMTKVGNNGSGFGKRVNPFTKKKELHSGIDLPLPEGEKVMSTADGVVLQSLNDTKRGNYVVIKHSDTYTTSYTHLKNAIVKVGDPIKKGETLGYVGSTGMSTAPHLHYEVLKNGQTVDPANYLPK